MTQTIILDRGDKVNYIIYPKTTLTYTRIVQPGSTPPYKPATHINGLDDTDVWTLGPFNEPRTYSLDVNAGGQLLFSSREQAGLNTQAQPLGNMAYQSSSSVTIYGGILESVSITGATLKSGGTGLQPATIADISNAATGTEIATAVNAIIAALKAVGAIASA